MRLIATGAVSVSKIPHRADSNIMQTATEAFTLKSGSLIICFRVTHWRPWDIKFQRKNIKETFGTYIVPMGEKGAVSKMRL